MNRYKAFAQAVAERAIKTACQTAVSLMGVGATGILDIDWTAVASASALAALLSILTSVASAGVGSPGPSLTTETTGATAKLDPASPSGESAADASMLPTDEPVETVPVVDVAYSSDTKADAAGYEPRHLDEP